MDVRKALLEGLPRDPPGPDKPRMDRFEDDRTNRPRGARAPEVAAERQVGGAAGAGVHGGAEGVEGRSDTVTGRRNTLCAAAKRLQGCAWGRKGGETPPHD